jgi:hypothetical protein
LGSEGNKRGDAAPRRLEVGGRRRIIDLLQSFADVWCGPFARLLFILALLAASNHGHLLFRQKLAADFHSNLLLSLSAGVEGPAYKAGFVRWLGPCRN